MSQCYTVRYELIPKTTEDLICDRLNAFIDKEAERTGWYYSDCSDRNNLDELMKLLIPPRAYQKLDDITYYGEFNASYGWGNVMLDAFKYCIPALDEGSYIDVCPDSGCTKIEVRDETVVEFITDEEEYDIETYLEDLDG